MSKLARTLVLGATLAAINLTGAVAQAQSNDESPSTQDARRPPSQGEVGEAWRQSQLPAEQHAVAGDTRRPPTESQVGESWRHPAGAPCGRPSRAASPAGSSHHSGC
jgi:hypothetical protein